MSPERRIAFRTSSFISSLAAALALVMTVACCTSERAPRSFVQPNALKKDDVKGTWYYLQTILDSPPTSSSAFIGLSSDLLKVRFDIQEDTLYARRAYEQVIGSEDAKTKDPDNYLGQPLAAWRITKHFDIIRDYNSTTGEETNKIIESEERPWGQREFIRVDWSKNLVNNYSGLFFDDSIKVESVSYWESDPGKPEAIHLERATADPSDAEFKAGEANYFDLTNKLVVTPVEFQFCSPDGICFKFPACFMPYQLADCSDSIMKVRHAFAKVSPQHQFEPRNWDGRQMDMFGLWDASSYGRKSYNRQYGVTNSGIVRHAARFNVWKKSYDADGKKLPYAGRQVNTIPYYADSSGATFPEDLFPESQKIVDQWNDAVGVAIADVRGKPTTERVFVWCHTPIKLAADKAGPADPVECKGNIKPDLDINGKPVLDTAGNPILRARQGDPRRSRIFWVNEMQLGGPLGYGPPMFDPETGETISGQAYIYGAALDTYAAYARDMVLLTSGRMDPKSFIQGVNVKDWVKVNAQGSKSMPPTITPAEVTERLGALDFSWTKGLAPNIKVDTSSVAAFKSSLKARQDAVFNTGIFGHGQGDVGEARRNLARGTPLEAMLVTPDLMGTATGRPLGTSWASLNEADKLGVSPLRRPILDTMMQDRNRRLSAQGFDFAEFADDGIAQRALRIARENKNPMAFEPETLWRSLRKDIYVAVTLHEVGHNVGLRHNFRASYDALNYHQKYWDLRTAGSRSTQKFAGLDPKTGDAIGVPYAGTDCTPGRLRPRYADCAGGAMSVEEAVGGVSEYQYTSVMDYGSNFNSDIQGLGRYDKAAMKFAYAGDGYVEVFTKTKSNDTARLKLLSLQYFSSNYYFPSPINFSTQVLQGMAYQTYPSMFQNGTPDLDAREDVPFANMEDFQQGFPLLVDKNSKGTTNVKPMVPYFFCGDEYAGSLTCLRFDQGADPYEQAHDLISRYENFYLLNNFKRDRYQFYTSSSYFGRIMDRYLEPLYLQMAIYTLFRASFPGEATGGDLLWGSEDGWASFGVAVTQGFDLLGRIITQPEAGNFAMTTADLSVSPYDHYAYQREDPQPDAPGQINIGLLDGKYSTSSWDGNCGYYAFDECQSRIGFFLDKILALQVMASGSGINFIGRDTIADARAYALGYILPFRKQILEKFGALLSGDYTALAPTLSADGVTIQKPSWTLTKGTVAPATGASRLIDPGIGFTLQLYATFYGLAGFPATFDQTFVDATRVFVIGNGEAPVPDSQLLAGPDLAGPIATFDPAQLVSASPPGTKTWFLWTEGGTGKTYAARALQRATKENSTDTFRIDAGVRMLEMARTLDLQTAKACVPGGDIVSCQIKKLASDQYRENIEIMRSVHKVFGYAPI